MNVTKIAAAFRLLADAIETPAAPDTAETAPAAGAATHAASAKRGPGRPPKTDASQGGTPGTATAPAQSATSPATPPASASAAPSTASASNLTHAIVANDFKAAAAKHGRDFVVGLMKVHNAPTFDKVPVAALADFQAALKAGPQDASGQADDLLG